MKIHVSKIKRRWLRRVAIVVSFPIGCVYVLVCAVGLALGLIAVTLVVEPIRRLLQWFDVVQLMIATAREQWK